MPECHIFSELRANHYIISDYRDTESQRGTIAVNVKIYEPHREGIYKV
jgi:hypothetical protein